MKKVEVEIKKEPIKVVVPKCLACEGGLVATKFGFNRCEVCGGTGKKI
jgi:exosome complex RNA-binding protein Csl4